MVEVHGLIDDAIGWKNFLSDQDGVTFSDRLSFGHVDNVYVQRTEHGDIVTQQAIGDDITQQSEKGMIGMAEATNKNVQPRSAWANGSFYLVVFAVVMTLLLVLGRTVPVYVLPVVLIAGAVFVPIIGALQLKQDGRLSDKSFLELIKLVIGQLPLIGKSARHSDSRPEIES